MPDPDDYEWDGPLITDDEHEMLRDLLRSEREKRQRERVIRIALVLCGCAIALFLVVMIGIALQVTR